MASSSTIRMRALVMVSRFGLGFCFRCFRRYERREENCGARAARWVIFNFCFAANLPRHSQDEFKAEPCILSCVESRRQPVAIIAHGHLIAVTFVELHRNLARRASVKPVLKGIKEE